MKLLTITLLFVCIASGQKIVGFDLNKKFAIGELQYHFQGIDDTSNQYLTTVGKDSIYNGAPYSAMVVLTFLQYADKYIQWCQDSIYKETGSMIIHLNEPIDTLGRFWSYRTSKDTVKAQRSHITFQGFIEWLREEVNSSKPTPQQRSQQRK